MYKISPTNYKTTPYLNNFLILVFVLSWIPEICKLF